MQVCGVNDVISLKQFYPSNYSRLCQNVNNVSVLEMYKFVNVVEFIHAALESF